jgi:hypothetical protein
MRGFRFDFGFPGLPHDEDDVTTWFESSRWERNEIKIDVESIGDRKEVENDEKD